MGRVRAAPSDPAPLPRSAQDSVISDIVLLQLFGIKPVLVHGGGPEINSWLTKVGIQPNFKNGLRVTDGPTMEVVEMVLVGKVNKSLVSLINRMGGKARASASRRAAAPMVAPRCLSVSLTSGPRGCRRWECPGRTGRR